MGRCVLVSPSSKTPYLVDFWMLKESLGIQKVLNLTTQEVKMKGMQEGHSLKVPMNIIYAFTRKVPKNRVSYWSSRNFSMGKIPKGTNQRIYFSLTLQDKNENMKQLSGAYWSAHVNRGALFNPPTQFFSRLSPPYNMNSVVRWNGLCVTCTSGSCRNYVYTTNGFLLLLVSYSS